MGIGRLRRLAASAGIVALTFGASALAVTTVATATSTMTATTAVNMRSGPGTSYGVLKVLTKGQAVQASGTVTKGWRQVTLNGTTGWVYTSYLAAASTDAAAPLAATAPSSQASPAAAPTTVPAGTVTTTAGVNVRSGPGTTYPIVGVAAKGLQLPTTGAVSNGWTQVTYGGASRWISATYLTAGATSVPDAKGQVRTTASLYLRSAGNATAPYDGVLPANSVVDTTGQTTADYTEIITGGRTRWIATSYTTSVAATAPAAPAAPTASGSVYVAVNTLNVRATSAPDGPVVGTVTRGTKLATTGVTEGDRTQVIHLGVARWVYTPFVSSAAPAAQLSIPSRVTTSGIAQLKPNAKKVVQYVLDNYPKIRTIYGWRASSAYSSDHPNGRAVDIMIPNWSDPEMADYGWQIARYFATNPGPYKVKYVIYRQSTFNVAYPSRGWRPMEDRGGVTANHYDHVHVSISD